MFNSLTCRRTWIALASLLLVMACSEDEGPASGADSVGDGISVDVQFVPDTNVAPDLAVADVSDFPGHGEPCSGPGDCASGLECLHDPMIADGPGKCYKKLS